MAKDRYYFSHDSNARCDEKILALRIKHDWKGYGLYWAIIEKMRENTDYRCVKDYNLIAFDLRVDAGIIKSIVEEFGLFVFTEDGKYFYSKRLINSMELVEQKSLKAKESAEKRWKKENNSCDSNANAMPTHTERNANKVKESKVNKKKESIVAEATTHTPDEIELFKKFNDWLSKNAPRVQQMKQPLTIDEYSKLRAKLSKGTLSKLLIAMQNRADLLKKYVSAYLTILNWSTREELNDTNQNLGKINGKTAEQLLEERTKAIERNRQLLGD